LTQTKKRITDVVVLAISMFAKLDKLWIAFGKGKDLRWIPIHEISNALGPRALCLPFVHEFTSCETVSAFRGKGKRTAWQVWEIFDDATDTFFRLSQTPAVIDDQDMEFIEAFVVIMYDRTTTTFPIHQILITSCRTSPLNSQIMKLNHVSL
jgi:hypothetical protein